MIYQHSAYSLDKNLGRCYNNFMKLIGPNDYALFTDADVLPLGREWFAIMTSAIKQHPKIAIFTVTTNRINCRTQQDRNAPKGDNIQEHWNYAIQKNGKKLQIRDITHKGLISGFCMLVSKVGWKKAGGFPDGMLGVDNLFHQRVKQSGGRVFLLPQLYFYHWYRGGKKTTDHLKP